MKRRNIIILLCIAILIVSGIFAYNTYFSSTKIAFVNFQTIHMGNISKANDNSFIRIKEVAIEELDKLTDFDMIFISGMGLRIIEEQRAQIQRAADKGIPIYTAMATNPANNICTIDSVHQKRLQEYLSERGKRNYRSLLNYVRKEIDHKLIYVTEPEEVIKRASDILYHADVKDPEEELDFVSVEEYEKFLKPKIRNTFRRTQ